MAHGGKRKGAGKPKGVKASHTIEASVARAKLIQDIHNDMDVFYAAWKDRALGHYEEREIIPGSGIVRVYKKAPDGNAIRDIMDRAMGRPVQPVDAKIDAVVDLSKRAKDMLAQLTPLHDDSRQTHSNVDEGASGGEEPGDAT